MTGVALVPSDLYHVGLVVKDIASAAERLSGAASYRWTKPMETTLPVITPSGAYDIPFSVIYSLEAPHLELVQEVPGTLWTARPGAAAHHFGYWVDDLGDAAVRLEDAGYRQAARLSGDELSMFAFYTDASGVLIEIVDRAMAPDWPALLKALAE